MAKNNPPPSEIYPDLRFRLLDYKGNTIEGFARIDGLTPNATWVSKNGAGFPLKQHGGFNLDIYGVVDHKDKWVPIDYVHDEILDIKLERKEITLPEYPKRTGNVQVTQNSAFDNQGFHLFLGTTLFPYLWMLRNDKVRLDKNLNYLAKNKVDYIRYFVEVGDPNNDTDSWSDRKSDPALFNVDEVNYLYDNFGIRSAICIFGGCFYSNTPDKRINTVKNVINIVRPISHKITWIEIVNEFRGQLNNPDEVRSLCKLAQSELPHVLCIPSSPEGWQEDYDTIYKDGTGSLGSIHHERTDKERMWGYVRGAYATRELSNVPSAFTNDEGQGPKSSGAQDDDPLRLAFFAATGYITKEPFFTLHTGAGVYMGGKGGVSHNREANIYEVINIDNIFKYINNVRDLLPKDVTSWAEYNGNKSEHLLPADYVWPDGYDYGVVRTYMARTDIAFVMLPYGIMQESVHRPKVNMTVSVYDISNKSLIMSRNLKPNDPPLVLPGEKGWTPQDKKCNMGYLVIGSF